MGIDIPRLMSELADDRPAFHSEADFQHALAWRLHQMYPDICVRLEKPTMLGKQICHLDILAWTTAGVIAIELKYKTARFTGNVQGEQFDLAQMGAYPRNRYLFLEDLRRVECCAGVNPESCGYAILLSNDSHYWALPAERDTSDKDFRLHKDRHLKGRLSWSDSAGGVKDGLEDPIILAGEYLCKWQDYSTVSKKTGGTLRYLVFAVGTSAL